MASPTTTTQQCLQEHMPGQGDAAAEPATPVDPDARINSLITELEQLCIQHGRDPLSLAQQLLPNKVSMHVRNLVPSAADVVALPMSLCSW
jgi:hypothetical protein